MSRARQALARAVWTTAGALIGICASYLLAAAHDTRDANQVQRVVQAYRNGWHAGAHDVVCLGVRYDTRTGQALP